MKFFVAVLFVASASAFPSQLPAGVDPSLCPAELYPNCFITGVPSAAVAALPTPIVNGQPIAPVLNTNLEQTAYYQQAQLVTSPANFPVPVVNGQPIAPVLNTNPEQTVYYQQAQVATAPANFPTPVVNGEPVAPVLNTVPAQTRHVELTQQQAAINLLQQQIDQQTIQIRQQQQEIEAQRHFGRL